MDNVQTSMLDRMDAAELAALPPGVLAELQWLVADEMVAAKRRDARLCEAIERRYGDLARAARVKAGKDTGVVHVADGNFDIAVNAPKKIAWDQAKLRAVLDEMTPEDARHYAKLAIAVEEKKYDAAPPAIQALLRDARTVSVGKITYAISPLKEAAA